MATKTPIKYKTLRKLENTKQSLSSNHEEIKESILENKLYKQLKELADEMINSVQYVINHRGYYENAGHNEAHEFVDLINNYGVRWNKHQKDNLQAYVVKLVNNLKY